MRRALFCLFLILSSSAFAQGQAKSLSKEYDDLSQEKLFSELGARAEMDARAAMLMAQEKGVLNPSYEVELLEEQNSYIIWIYNEAQLCKYARTERVYASSGSGGYHLECLRRN